MVTPYLDYDVTVDHQVWQDLKTRPAAKNKAAMACSPQAVTYADALRGPWNTKQLPLLHFLQHQQESWGKETYQRFEVLYEEQMVTPYLDYDVTVQRPVTPEDHQEHLDRCLKLLSQVFEGHSVYWGQSHGWVPQKRTHKVSLRFWIWGVVIKMKQMPDLLRQLDLHTTFDMNVYHSQQKLRVPGACKGDGDVRVLELGDRQHARFCLAQVYDPEGRSVEALPVEISKSSSFGGDAPPPEWDDVKELLEDHGFINAVYKGRRPHSLYFTSDCLGLPCPCGCGNVHDSHNYWVSKGIKNQLRVKSYSENCRLLTIGEEGPMFVPEPEMIVPVSNPGQLALQACGLTCQFQPGKDSIDRDCMWAEQHLEDCPTCRIRHTSGMWYVYPHAEACWSFRNADMNCKERFVAKVTNEHLIKIMRNPLADQAYVDLYLSEQRTPLLSNGKTVFRFNGITWVEWTDARMKTEVQTWLKVLMERLLTVVDHEASKRVVEPRVANPGKTYRQLEIAEKHVNQERSINNFISAIKRAEGVYDELMDASMNADPYLLGTGNGVIDLHTCQFRQAQPDDRVTMTVGYDFPDHVDPEMEAQVQDFMDQCYPVLEEQEILRRYAGYLLLGLHNEKVFLLLTDERQGYNGKSTVLSLLAATMGQYATKADPVLIYKSDGVRNINDHSSGLLAFEKTRFVYLEECDGSKCLNDSMLKDYNGGSTRVSGRQIHDSKLKEFPWITKLAMCFNSGNCPAFNVDDEALVERMLTVCHRSRFYTEDVPDLPYSFKADSNIKDNFVGDRWLPYMLKWCLQGLTDYHDNGFRNVPDSCKAFKKQLVANKDYIGEFIRDAVEVGGPKDCVKVKELFNEFDQVHRAKQRDRKTQKTLADFQCVVSRCFPNAVYKKSFCFRDDNNVVKKACSVMVGCKRKHDDL